MQCAMLVGMSLGRRLCALLGAALRDQNADANPNDDSDEHAESKVHLCRRFLLCHPVDVIEGDMHVAVFARGNNLPCDFWRNLLPLTLVVADIPLSDSNSSREVRLG